MTQWNRKAIYSANSLKHNGSVDEAGHPTYGNDADWVIVVSGWPVEFRSVRGTEVIWGRQMSAETTHLAIGEYYGGEAIESSHRVVINGTTYGVVSVLDRQGLNRELEVQLKREE